MNKKILGQCHCQKIQFEMTLPSEYCSHCHCESCRRIHGSGYVTWTSFPSTQIEIIKGSDKIHTYESSPGVKWMSCSFCASPLFQKAKNSKERTYVPLSAINGKLDRNPQCHYSIEEKVRWVEVNDELPKHNAKASDVLN